MNAVSLFGKKNSTTAARMPTAWGPKVYIYFMIYCIEDIYKLILI